MEESATTCNNASTPTKVAVAKLRRLRCLDWLQKQNSEEPKKQWLQNKNLNDIQFIVETNAERSNFLKKAAEDDATVPAGVDDTQVEPKVVPLHLLRIDSLLLECGWQECYWNTSDYEKFQKHVWEHVRDLIISEIDGEAKYACLWDTCGHKTQDSKEILRHLHYHAYHAKLLAVGYNGRATLKLEQCQKDSTKRNQLPILPDDFICRWIDCGFTFSCIQTFYTHVLHHVMSAPRPWCFWAGCGYKHKRREVLKQHMRTHTGERLIACYHCGRRFCSNRKLLDHLRRQNTSSSLSCAVCGAAQGSQYLLRAHTRAHVSMHACALCDMSAPTLSALAQHVRYRHMRGHRAHQCPRCHYRAITKWDLRKHIPTHFKKKKSEAKKKVVTDELEETSEKEELSDKEGLSNDENEEVKQKPKKTKKYICHMCPEKSQKIFTRGSLLTTHLVKLHGAQWSFGHSRFRYTISDDGLYRLTTTRYETLEVSEKMMMGGNCTGPRTIPNSIQFQLVKKCEATEKSPQQFEVMIKEERDNEAEMPSTVEIEMCDVDEHGNIISKEVVKSDVYFTS